MNSEIRPPLLVRTLSLLVASQSSNPPTVVDGRGLSLPGSGLEAFTLEANPG